MKKERLEVIRGSGNIYRDLAIANADVRQLKVTLAPQLIKTIDRNGTTVRQAQALPALTRTTSHAFAIDFRRMSVERLMGITNRLGERVDVVVKVRRRRASDYSHSYNELLRTNFTLSH